MKLTLTKQEVLLIQLLLHIYKNELPDDGTEKHGRFVGKLYKKIKRQVINQLKITINKPTEFEAVYLEVDAGVRY